jgi:hypothetical protein
MSLRGACGLLLLGVVLGFLTPLPIAAQALSTFDDFSTAEVDGARWSGTEGTVRFATAAQIASGRRLGENPLTQHPSFSTFNTSALRRVVGGQLQLQLDSVGGTHPNPDVAPGYGSIGVSGRMSSRFVVQVKITPMAAEAPPCRATGESRVQSNLALSLLGDPAGAVFATLSLERSSFGGDRIIAVLRRCTSDECSVIEELGSVVFNRTWSLGRTHTLTVRQHPANGSVGFTVAGGGGAAETRVLRFAPVAEGTYVWSEFGMRVETTPANCPASGDAPAERVEVTMDARFDDVRIVAGP